MAHETYNQLAEMFALASELPAADRAIYLDRECAGKPELRRRVEDLLAHDQASDDLLEHPPWEAISIETSADEGARLKSNHLDRLLAAARLDDPILTTPSMVDAGHSRINTNADTPDHQQQIFTGLTIDKKYRIDRVLGKGAMGAVYLATHLGTTRTVALKVINPEHAAQNEFLIRFR